MSPSLYPALPPPSLLKFDPFSNSPVVSPPYREKSLLHPFNIRPEVYNQALSVVWPLTIAISYVISVTFVNRKNRERKFDPWSISRKASYYYLVLAHNVFLAVYSLWTFVGMFQMIRTSWPGWKAEYGLAGAVDALCKLHGPRGPGSAAIYDTSSKRWGISDVTMRLEGGNPDSTDVGRIWNEGLAYYGWIFYLSKFYEVVDTAIILTKGKKSSSLQTYHHAGAMFAMWSGIRYMSPPIWMFTFINSLIHTLMVSDLYQ